MKTDELSLNTNKNNITDDMDTLKFPTEWKYEMRRGMQEIIPRLWIGPYTCAKNLSLLKSNGITHILTIRDPGESHIIKTLFPQDFEYFVMIVLCGKNENKLLETHLSLSTSTPYTPPYQYTHILNSEASDSPFQKLIPHFASSNQFIHLALFSSSPSYNTNNHNTIFVHCNGGISKSPVFVIAYLMQMRQLPVDKAISIVQQRRFCTIISENLLLQLKEFEYIYPAQEYAAHIQNQYCQNHQNTGHGDINRMNSNDDNNTISGLSGRSKRKEMDDHDDQQQQRRW